MLKKLLKYEIDATARLLLPLYFALFVFSAVYKFIAVVSPNKWQAPQVISLIIYIMILTGIFVMTFILIIQRFYKNLLTDEGYLMFTLPTKPWNHVICKLLISMLWTAVSGIVAIASILIVTFDQVFTADNMRVISEVIRQISERIDVSLVFLALEGLLMVLISLASGILIVYASIALGHLFNKHKILTSLGAFIVLSTVTQILFTIAGVIGSRIPMRFGEINDLTNVPPEIHFIAWCFIIFTGVITVGYYLITNYILSRRLNLE